MPRKPANKAIIINSSILGLDYRKRHLRTGTTWKNRWPCQVLLLTGEGGTVHLKNCRRITILTLDDWSRGEQWNFFPENLDVSRETLRFEGNKINCSPRDQSLVICYIAKQLGQTGGKQIIMLRSGNTGNIFLQLVLQHCCSVSWNSLLRVLPPAWPTCSATKHIVANKRNPARMIGQSCVNKDGGC